MDIHKKKIEEIAKVYSENVECSDCPFVQECWFENGNVFEESKCAEFVLKIIEGEEE